MTGMAPLPVIALSQYLLVKKQRKWEKMGTGLGEEAAKCTSQVLKEIKTVREFAMEAEEAEKYSGMAYLKADKDLEKQAIIRLCHRAMHLLRLAGEAATLIIGIQKVA